MGLRGPKPLDAAAREALFWSKVALADDSDPGRCWEWLEGKDRKGYGRFWGGDRKILAHHYAYIVTCGPIPGGACLLHECDNPGCVRPSHLTLGTIPDNNADAKAKRRHAHGERQGFAKLDDATVANLREQHRAGMSTAAIGRLHNVTQSAAWRAVAGKTWAHVTG